MKSDVRDLGDHFVIPFGETGRIYLQRKEVIKSTDKPISIEEFILIELCTRLTKDNK